MKHLKMALLLIPVATLLCVGSCGKKEEKAKTDETVAGSEKKGADTETSSLKDIAMEARGIVSVDEELAGVREMMETAGFMIKSYEGFPAQEVGRKGRMLVYTDKGAKRSGGVVFFKKTGPTVAQCWHWHFKDMVPDAVTNVEMNGDGLWDVQVASNDGQVINLIQDDSFTLTAADRSDWIAMNGTSSEPVSEDAAMWKCFDGDTTSAWQSSTGPDDDAFLELDVPFGVKDGMLVLQTLASNQPSRCTVYADGKQLQVIDLEPKAARQITHLDGAAKGAKTIRLVFNSGQGQGNLVSVAEVTLK
ncbi:MAG: hypothetical protein JSW58_08710 [Candidatus Latescibacterota bacterium]|nr:MAG: hypothetical protein JSW58_08710 [Candidatus Latescibacterota bacterium]